MTTHADSPMFAGTRRTHAADAAPAASLRRVLATALHLPAYEAPPAPVPGEVVASAAVRGPCNATIELSMQRSTGERLATLMWSRRCVIGDPDFNDALAELVGLIAGGCVADLGGTLQPGTVTLDGPIDATTPADCFRTECGLVWLRTRTEGRPPGGRG